MTINEKIRKIRINYGMSQAELAYKTDLSIDEIKAYEINGNIINAYELLKILKAFKMRIDDFIKI